MRWQPGALFVYQREIRMVNTETLSILTDFNQQHEAFFEFKTLQLIRIGKRFQALSGAFKR